MKSHGLSIFITLLLSLNFIQNISCQNLYETPTHLYDSGHKDGTVIKISPDNQNFIIGYSTGLLIVYKTSSGSVLHQIKNHSSSIIHIVWEQGNLMTIDLSGLVIKWNQQFQIITRWNVPNQFTNCDSVKIGQTVYISFNYQTKIEEYLFKGVSMTKGVTFTQQQLTQFYLFSYDSTHTYLYATMVTGQNIIFYIFNQTQKKRFFTNFRIISMDSVPEQSPTNIIATDQNDVYKINQDGILSSSSQFGTVITNCKNQQIFILTSFWTMFYTLNKQTLRQTQYYSYPVSNIKAVACSDEYFITTDQAGWITINQYQQSRPLTIIIMSIIFLAIIITIFIANKKLIKNSKNKSIEDNNGERVETQNIGKYEQIRQNNQLNSQ